MSPDKADIVIVRDGETYRLLHGHLRLFNILSRSDEVRVDVHGEGAVTVVRSRAGYLIGKDGQRIPLMRN